MNAPFDRASTFGRFVLLPARKLLLEDGRPVAVGSRALELLTALLERPGELISRDELIARVWPDTIVEETNLRVHLSALRKVLDDGRDGTRYITNVTGRGYCFVGQVDWQPEVRHSILPDADISPQASHNLPLRLTRPIGRQAITAFLGARVARERLVTIAGPGGIGKTTVALALAETLLPAYEDGVRFVELAPLSEGAHVPVALAAALGVAVCSEEPWTAIEAFLCDLHMLIVLDNCEHVIDVAAELSERVLKAARGIHIVATSREPLGSEGEWVYRLAPLETPAAGQALPADAALRYPAVELFVERARANCHDFSLTESTLPRVLELCRRLDGMPLALELAAARIESLGLQGLASRMDDMFALLQRGRRTALPRHRTLQALLDWSYKLLSPDERLVLQRLSAFRTAFSLESAVAVASGEDLEPAAVVDCVSGLVAKSLVAVDGHAARYALLFVTRCYAAEKLAASGERARISRRHAEHFRDLLERSGWIREDSESVTPEGGYAAMLDDVRAALEWAFGPEGDLRIGVSLTVAAIDLVLDLGLWDEFSPRMSAALAAIPESAPDASALELRLRSTLCHFGGIVADGSDADEARRAFARIDDLIVRVDARRYSLEALYGMCANALGRGEYPTVLALCDRIRALANGPTDPVLPMLSERLRAMGCHYLGDHDAARKLATRLVDHGRDARWRMQMVPLAVSMRILLARTLWLEGYGAQATQMALESLHLSTGGRPLYRCHALALAVIPIALWRGDDVTARSMVDQLIEHSTRYALSLWIAWGHSYRVVLARRGAGCALPDTSTASWNPAGGAKALDMMGTLVDDMAVAQTCTRVDAGVVGWCAPEILRARAETLRRQRSRDADGEVEALLLRSLGLARTQGALAWELRTATSLASLRRDQGRTGEALALLAPISSRIVEDLEAADARAARELIRALEESLLRRLGGRHG